MVPRAVASVLIVDAMAIAASSGCIDGRVTTPPRFQQVAMGVRAGKQTAENLILVLYVRSNSYIETTVPYTRIYS